MKNSLGVPPDLEGASGDAVLWSNFARSVRDNVLAEVVVQVIRVSAMVILARILLPQDFGLFKVLLVISFMGVLVYQAGVPDALIQRQDLQRVHESTALWTSVLLGLLSSALLWLMAPLIAHLMKMPALEEGVKLLCIPLLLEATVVISNARLRRRLRFGALALADVTAEIAFLGTALGAVWCGLPAWSLPLALGVRLVVNAITIWIAEPKPPLGMPRLSALRDLWRFAMSVSGSQVVYVISNNADYILVGRFLGTAALGFYTIAWDLLRFIPDRLNQVAGRVTYPAFCRLQNDNNKLADAYCDFFAYIAKVVLPVVAVVAIASPEIIVTLYGSKWEPAAIPLRWLAVGLSLCGLRVGIGSIFYCKDYPSADTYLHTLRLALVIGACTFFARFGLIGISAAMSIVEAAISLVGIYVACRLIDLKLMHFALTLLPAAKLTVFCAISAGISKAAALYAGLEGPIVLLTIAPLPIAIYCWFEAPTLARMIGTAFDRSTREALNS